MTFAARQTAVIIREQKNGNTTILPWPKWEISDWQNFSLSDFGEGKELDPGVLEG